MSLLEYKQNIIYKNSLNKYSHITYLNLILLDYDNN